MYINKHITTNLLYKELRIAEKHTPAQKSLTAVWFQIEILLVVALPADLSLVGFFFFWCFMAVWQTNDKGALPPPTDLECGVYIHWKKLFIEFTQFF